MTAIFRPCDILFTPTHTRTQLAEERNHGKGPPRPQRQAAGQIGSIMEQRKVAFNFIDELTARWLIEKLYGVDVRQ